MKEILFLIALFQGYLLGSLNAAILVGKIYGVDVRSHGSGNAGMTNTLRTLGKLPAVMVTIGDMLKAVLACVIGSLILQDLWGFSEVGLMAGGFGAILGHNWPVYFGFRGGKGVLTTFALILMMDYQLALILLGIFLLLVSIFKYVSLGSVVASLGFPVLGYFLRGYLEIDALFILFAAFVSGIVIIKHRANIKRLFQGTENKLGAKRT
jgi:acyl phosphate:glycerol-3-phosphate acyltransferase